jgi:hypothetical protein
MSCSWGRTCRKRWQLRRGGRGHGSIGGLLLISMRSFYINGELQLIVRECRSLRCIGNTQVRDVLQVQFNRFNRKIFLPIDVEGGEIIREI